jgi:dipeptidyl aminopeptidase/acylaminoacyl peptidase
LDQGGLVLIDVPGPADMPDNRPYSPFSFENPAGQRVDGFVATPGGEGPFPTVMSVHGGPEWEDADAFDARVQAFTDHGCAVGMVNYRGSTGQGADWREALRGDIGFPETEDVVVGLDALVDAGIADPERAFIEGASWGGYITLLAIGLHPERWRGAVASVPVGDLVACHEDCSPAQQAYDVAIMGGDPTDLPELYAERSPITYVGSVRCPVLVFAGEHDSACPIRQVRNYVRALEAHGGRVTLRTRSFGHHANTAGERIEEMRLALEFLQAQMGAG